MLFLELAILALFAVAVVCGRFDQDIFFFVYIFGVIAVVSAATSWALPRKIVKKLLTHGALIVGCIIFSLPFVWLVSTSFKYDEEIFVYPPKWIPSIPGGIVRSPYVTLEDYTSVIKPASISKNRWEQLWPKLQEALWQEGRAILGDERMVGLNEQKLRAALANGLWVAVSPSIARDTWQGRDEQIIDVVVARIDTGRVDGVWRNIFRSVALRDVTVQDIHRVERAIGERRNGRELWRPEYGEIRCVPRVIEQKTGGNQPLTIEYNFNNSNRAAVAAVLPLPIPVEEFLSVTIPIRQDRSWHRLTVELEMDGKRYVPEDNFYLGNRRWQEITFKLKSKDPRDERSVGVWPLEPAENHAGAFSEPGKFRITLGIERSSRIAATWHKFTDSYRQAYWATKYRWNYLFNSVYLVVLTIIGQMFACSMVAYAFARLKWPGRDILFGVLLATMMLPPQVTMIPVFMIFRDIGWYNTLKPLWAPSFFGAAFFIFLLRQFMRSIPAEIEEAAKLDGCGFFGIYWRIILPLMKPALAAVAIFTFMATWNDFMGPLIYVNDQRLYPLALGLFNFRTQHGSELGMLMAASTMVTLPVIAVFFLAQKYFIQGITLTGMKG
jgi:ABC-type glycerol-3-phosphate transport system permease component